MLELITNWCNTLKAAAPGVKEHQYVLVMLKHSVCAHAEMRAHTEAVFVYTGVRL
jgi:hypothetical protein